MKRATILLALLALLLASGAALAQKAEPYDLTWNTIDGGGQTFGHGGTYLLGGTIGQSDADLLRGGTFVLGGGFWKGGSASGGSYSLYLPMVVKSFP